MYQTQVRGEGLFEAVSTGYGAPVVTYGVTEKGETPVSLLLIALSSCVTMCVQGYYASKEGKKEVVVTVDGQLRGEEIVLQITVDEELSAEKEAALLAYIAAKCRVKQLLRPDLEIEYQFIGRGA